MSAAKGEIAIALGTFDGLHTGHMTVLKNAVNSARHAICVSFLQPPAANTENFGGMLMQPQSKLEMLYEIGFEKVELLDFDAVREKTAKVFLDTLCRKYKPSVICCGFNYSFGKNRGGDIAFLRDYCEKHGILLSVQEPVIADGDVVSSGRIRHLLSTGECERANALLGREWSFKATVQHGDKRGRTIGFPTINQQLPSGFVIPRFGVYATHTTVEGKTYRSITNIGIRPTFRLEAPLCETYILGLSGDLYGNSPTLGLSHFIRPEIKFDSLSQLKRQIDADKSTAFGGV